MKTNSSKVLTVVVVLIIAGVFLLPFAYDQPGSASDSAGSVLTVRQASNVNLVTGYQGIESVSADKLQAFESLISTARQTKMSFADALGDMVDKAKDKASELADAVTDAKDGAGRQFSEWQKQREEAAREREEAKARAMEVLEGAKLTKKKETLEYSEKKARPLKLVECSDPRVEVAADEEIDCSKPGTTKVAYTLFYDGQSVKREVEFQIRDTKVPQIDFVDVAPKVNVGDSYVPAKNVNFVKDPVDGELDRVDSAPEAKGKEPGAEVFYDEGWYTVKGSVDTMVEGVYTIEVDAFDVNGNTKHRTFDVTVVASAPKPEALEAAMMKRSMANGQNDEEARQAWLNEEVYITPTGKCYHTATCKSKGSNSWAVTRQEAKNKGLRACGKCNPDRGHLGW